MMRNRLVEAILIASVLSCGSDATGPVVQIPAALTVVDGDAQTAAVASAVAKAPSVKITDDKGAVISGVIVTFAVASGGGTITAPVDTTDASGIASVGAWTLGTTVGANTLTATSGSLSATITATSTAGRAFSITPVAGKDQSATVGSSVAIAPSVAVRDTFANPVAGAAVTFAVATGGGSVTGATATSDANGIATLGGWKLGTTVGANSLTVTSGTLTATFAATALIGPPAHLLPFPSNSTAELRGPNSVGTGPNAQVTDAFNNPIPGVTVAFSVGANGGSIGSGAGVTNEYGLAWPSSWTVGSQPGDYSVTATLGSMSVTFYATVLGPRTNLRIAMVASGPEANSTCALDENGHAYCWGDNGSGQLGDGTIISRAVPTAVAGGLIFSSITVGPHHSCGLTLAGTAYCWGGNLWGSLGNGGGTQSSSIPVPVSGGLTFKSLAASGHATCGLIGTGQAYCWGDDGAEELGNGFESQSSNVPAPVAGGLVFSSLAAGFGHFCAVTVAGEGYCWGGGYTPYMGELGNGTLSYHEANSPSGLYRKVSASPSGISGGLTFAHVFSGPFTTCGIDGVGKAYCWGRSIYGELGDGTTALSRGVPVAVSGGDSYVALAIGEENTCGLLSSGATRCWGRNDFGEFGNGQRSFSRSSVPADAITGIRLSSLTSGFAHRCGLDTSGQVLCWGRNDSYQLGDGTSTDRLSPIVVAFYQ